MLPLVHLKLLEIVQLVSKDYFCLWPMPKNRSGKRVLSRMTGQTLGHKQVDEAPALFSAGHVQREGTAEVRFNRGGNLGSLACSVCHSACCAPSPSQLHRSFTGFSLGNSLCIPNPKAVAELLALGSARRVTVRLVLIDMQPFIVFSLCNHCTTLCSGVHTFSGLQIAQWRDCLYL